MNRTLATGTLSRDVCPHGPKIDSRYFLCTMYAWGLCPSLVFAAVNPVAWPHEATAVRETSGRCAWRCCAIGTVEVFRRLGGCETGICYIRMLLLY